MVEGRGYDFGHGGDLRDGELVVDSGELLSRESKQSGRGRVTADDGVHPALPFIGSLRIEIVDGGLLGIARAEVADVADNADDGHPVGRFGAGPIDARAKRAL